MSEYRKTFQTWIKKDAPLRECMDLHKQTNSFLISDCRWGSERDVQTKDREWKRVEIDIVIRNLS